MKRFILFLFSLCANTVFGQPPVVFTEFDLSHKVITVGSVPGNMTNFNGKLMFSALDSVAGREPWISDGIKGNTKVLRDIQPGSVGSFPTVFTVYNNKLYFAASTSLYGSELWESDGTALGTKLVKDIYSGTGSSKISGIPFAFLNGRMYFRADDSLHGIELWTSDGTDTGTYMVKDIMPGKKGGAAGIIYDVVYSGKLYFVANDSVYGNELWATDGTDTGTYMVKDINPGVASSLPANIFQYNGKLFFNASDTAYGRELWMTDGTPGGTSMVKDINVGKYNSDPLGFVEYNNKLYFSANDSIQGTEIWVTDGTAQGTQIFKDMNPGKANGTKNVLAAGLTENALIVYNNMLYFNANDSTNGHELWVTDGTVTSIKMVKDINQGIGNSSPWGFFLYKKFLYFLANNTGHGDQLHISNGTDSGTYMIAPPNATISTPFTSSDFSPVMVDSIIYIRANYFGHGGELVAVNDTTSYPVVNIAEITGTQQLTLYPNPVKDVLAVAGVEQGDELQVTTSTGKNINLQGKVTISNNTATINTSQLQPGIYFLRKGASVVRFVKLN